MVKELEEPVAVEVRGSEFRVFAQGSFTNLRVFPNNVVEKMGQDFELHAHEDDKEDDDEAEVSIEDAPLDEPFAYKDLDLMTF
uniref:Uncharacterized protein n=1 Tax=Cannabis sativa TaxID=3483 RepID=A0A803QGN2_CANSA